MDTTQTTAATATAEGAPMNDIDRAERLAQAFHETYERLAPSYRYETRPATAVPWADVPEPNRSLMIAVAGHILGTWPSWIADRDQFDQLRLRKAVLNLEAEHRFDPASGYMPGVDPESLDPRCVCGAPWPAYPATECADLTADREFVAQHDAAQDARLRRLLPPLGEHPKEADHHGR